MIDLSTCKEGDLLISKHGTRLFYVRPLSEEDYYDHIVKYEDERRGKGSRTNDGFVFRDERARMSTDEDIVAIIPR